MKQQNKQLQGTIGCTPNSVPMVYLLCSLGILGDFCPPINSPLFFGFFGPRDFPQGRDPGVHPDSLSPQPAQPLLSSNLPIVLVRN